MYISKELKKHENKKVGEGSENDWILVSLWGNMFIWSSILIRLQGYPCPGFCLSSCIRDTCSFTWTGTTRAAQ